MPFNSLILGFTLGNSLVSMTIGVDWGQISDETFLVICRVNVLAEYAPFYASIMERLNLFDLKSTLTENHSEKTNRMFFY